MADLSRVRTKAELASALDALRARAGLSYHVLAEATGISTSTLQKMVTGQSLPRARTLELFMQACGEHDTRAGTDALARVRHADSTVQRKRTPAGKQVQVGVIPQPADGYLDRDVAARLAEAVEQDGTVLTQVLTGMGGVGKTLCVPRISSAAVTSKVALLAVRS